MRNRAKCKLCETIIESFHTTDLVPCKCGEIFVDGGNGLKCGANDWNNFLRVDDLGNEIIVKVGDVKPLYIESEKPSKEDLIKMLDEMVKNIEALPQEAMLTSVNHYDFCSLMILLSSIMKS